ncbi:hypothetical protein Q9L42_017785 [Methylomarinum sp. Ch1-1]|uniref:Uncharacterized protein n=1 Tax=Methylomarinum roseum TaxID=3067653 RepID=A0AAU7NU95_9GAMM|nr:hypothetical protein [Methylomarinum sp. Ch1-1]MDP4519808.1 hypothetical protein [Methylomarinum sp. Ch1-1]
MKKKMGTDLFIGLIFSKNKSVPFSHVSPFPTHSELAHGSTVSSCNGAENLTMGKPLDHLSSGVNFEEEYPLIAEAPKNKSVPFSTYR